MQRIEGIVQKGSKRARALGFPTANIALPKGSLSGIYAARVGIGRATYGAAVYADPTRALLETHVLDFSGELYGSVIVVEVYEKIRERERFDSERALRRAIADDVESIRAYLREH